jgi:hypothetical protein
MTAFRGPLPARQPQRKGWAVLAVREPADPPPDNEFAPET